MDHIAIYVDGRSSPGKGSGFAVILLSTSNKWERSFAYGMHTVNAADMLAVKYGLLSIAKPFEKVPVIVYTKNQYVADMMKISDDGVYDMIPKANADLIQAVRDLVKGKNVKFVVGTENEYSEKCHEMVMAAINDNKLVDARK